jgi:uncharacterized protein YbjQ (UPF0145 family)
MLTVTEQIPGYRIIRALGIVHGVAMQHVAPVDATVILEPETAGAPPRTAHDVLTDMIDAHLRARNEAVAYMIRFAAEMGANGVVGVRYDRSKVSDTQTEFLAYGTAVWAERLA